MSVFLNGPREIDIEITSRCNLRCKYCYFYDNSEIEYSDLPFEVLQKLIDEIALAKTMFVTLSGGEPFIRNDLMNLINYIIKKPIRYSILSNGSLITNELAAFIASTSRCQYIQISLDGSCREIHDVFRGPGSFDGAVRGIRLLNRYNVPVAIRVTVHKQNLHDLKNVAHFILSELQIPSFGVNSASFFGTCRNNESKIQLSVSERFEAMNIFLELSAKYPDQIQAMAGPLAEAIMWRQMINAADSNALPFPNGGRLTGCGCVNSKLAIRSDGSYVPCLLLPEIVLGKINRDRLIDIWNYAPDLLKLRARKTVSLDTFEFCRSCRFIPYCTGNCPALAFSLLGKTEHPSPDACLSRYLSEGGQVPE
jgi:SynChlorMet cassette radical SAM/SPASM protein ScmE